MATMKRTTSREVVEMVQDARSLAAFWQDCDDPEFVATMYWDTTPSAFRRAMRLAIKKQWIDAEGEWVADTLAAHRAVMKHGVEAAMKPVM